MMQWLRKKNTVRKYTRSCWYRLSDKKYPYQCWNQMHSLELLDIPHWPSLLHPFKCWILFLSYPQRSKMNAWLVGLVWASRDIQFPVRETWNPTVNVISELTEREHLVKSSCWRTIQSEAQRLFQLKKKNVIMTNVCLRWHFLPPPTLY